MRSTPARTLALACLLIARANYAGAQDAGVPAPVAAPSAAVPAADAGVAEAPSTPPAVESPSPAAASPGVPAAAAPAAQPVGATNEPPAAAGAATVVEPPGTSLFESSGTDTTDDGTAGSASSTPSEGPRLTLGGYVRGDMFVGAVPGYSQGLIQAGYGELALKLDAQAEEHGDAYAELRARYGQQGEARRLFLDLREAYVNLYVGSADLRLGQQIIVWGRADAFNPTNVLMPIDLRVRSPIEDDRRLGNLGARLIHQVVPVVRFEAVWLPLYLATEYPPLPLDEYVTMVEPDFPAPELENGLLAARVHVELSSFEGSLSAVRGYAPLPGLALREYTVGVDPPEVRIARTAYRQHVFGLDFSTAFGDVLALRGEAAYRQPLDYESSVHAARPDVHYVIGVDRAFGPVSVILQYMGRVVFDWEREDGPEDPIDPDQLVRFMPPLPRPLARSITTSIEEELAQRNQVLFSQTERVQHLASARIEWLTLHEALSLSALGMVNFTTREWLLFPKLGYKISDAMTVYAGAEVYVGPADTLLDLIDQELTAGFAELRYGF